MSVPNPTGPKARSTVGVVLEYIQSLLGTATSETEQTGSTEPPQELEHPASQAIIDELESAASALKTIDQKLVPEAYKKLDDLRAVLRHQCTIATKEYGKAKDTKTQQTLESVFTELGKKATSLKDEALDLQKKSLSVQEYGAIKEKVVGALITASAAQGIASAQQALKTANDNYGTKLSRASASETANLVDAVKQKLEELTQAEQTEKEAKHKASEKYEALKEQLAQALAAVSGPKPVVDAQGLLKTAQENYTAGVDTATAQQTEGLVEEIVKQLEAVKLAKQTEAEAKKKVGERYESIKVAVAEALGKLPESGKALTDLQDKLKKAEEDYLAKAVDGTAEELDGLLKRVEAELPEVVKARESHANDVEKTKYYKRLKKCHARIAAIDKAIADKKYGDPPADPLDKKVADYSSARLEVKKAQDALKFADANKALTKLEAAAGEVEKARLTALDGDITGADTADKVKAVVDKLEANEIRALGPDKQVALLATLRTTAGKDITEKDTPDLYKARCKIYDNMPMHPECDKQDKVFRASILTAFDSDVPEPDDPKYPDYKGKTPKEIFEQVKKDWGTLTADKQFKFLSFAAKKQCAVMGHPEPDVVQGTDPGEYPPRSCSNIILTCKTIGCTHRNKTWNYLPAKQVNCAHCNQAFGVQTKCGTAWPTATGKGTCTNPKCGAVDTGNKCSFGGCDLGFISGAGKSTITLNANQNVIGDFQETFDTIMHENAHNYQLYLIQRYRTDKNQLFVDIPSARDIEDQIKMWDENANGYVGGGPTYNNQPLELHAWKFGRKMATKKIKPKAKTKPGDKPDGVSDLA